MQFKAVLFKSQLLLFIIVSYDPLYFRGISCNVSSFIYNFDLSPFSFFPGLCS